MTQHLAALETVVGTPLFTRTARQMLPTERARQLYSEIIGALEALERATLGLRRGTPVPEVRLGAPREYFSVVARSQLAQADLRLWVRFGLARPLLEALRAGELDMVIAAERLLLRELEYRKLASEEFVLVCAAAVTPPPAPVNASERAALEQWALAQPWISYARDLPIIRRFWRQGFGSRPALQPWLIVPDLLTLADAVAAGSGISVLPRYLCAPQLASGSLRCVWAPDPPVTNDLWLAWRVGDRQRPELAAVQAALLGQAAALPAVIE